MATKARHLKTAMQLWVADNRKASGMSSAEIATLTGVTEDTARGWESRGSPGQDAIATLEKRFGKKAPPAEGVGDSLVEALRAQTAAITDLVEEMRLARDDPASALRGIERALELVATLREGEASGSSSGPRSPADARR